MLKFTINELQSSTAINDNARQWAIDNIDYLNKPMKLFGSSNKVEKGSDKYDTRIMYLQPADKVATNTLCIGADASGCKKPCLISSGQLGMDIGQRAATKRTILWLLRRDWFTAQLLKEIDAAELRATREGIPALFRLNGTSDIDFSDIIAQRPNSQFYDYTKVLSRIRKNTSDNYDLTFSASMATEQSRRAFSKALDSGYRIAIAFNTKGIARDLLKLPLHLISFDDTDLRHLDDSSAVGYLKRKGSNVTERNELNLQANSFFVTQANVDKFNAIIGL